LLPRIFKNEKVIKRDFVR